VTLRPKKREKLAIRAGETTTCKKLRKGKTRAVKAHGRNLERGSLEGKGWGNQGPAIVGKGGKLMKVIMFESLGKTEGTGERGVNKVKVKKRGRGGPKKTK